MQINRVGRDLIGSDGLLQIRTDSPVPVVPTTDWAFPPALVLSCPVNLSCSPHPCSPADFCTSPALLTVAAACRKSGLQTHKYWNTGITSPLVLLFTRLAMPSSCNRSSYALSHRDPITVQSNNRVASLCLLPTRCENVLGSQKKLQCGNTEVDKMALVRPASRRVKLPVHGPDASGAGYAHLQEGGKKQHKPGKIRAGGCPRGTENTLGRTPNSERNHKLEIFPRFVSSIRPYAGPSSYSVVTAAAREEDQSLLLPSRPRLSLILSSRHALGWRGDGPGSLYDCSAGLCPSPASSTTFRATLPLPVGYSLSPSESVSTRGMSGSLKLFMKHDCKKMTELCNRTEQRDDVFDMNYNCTCTTDLCNRETISQPSNTLSTGLSLATWAVQVREFTQRGYQEKHHLLKGLIPAQKGELERKEG
ncbi:hypothetical protein L345_13449, partial [Ophiophagus hannah]